MARPVIRIPVPVGGPRSEVRSLIVALAAAASLLLALAVVLVGSARPVAGHSQLLIGGTPR